MDITDIFVKKTEIKVKKRVIKDILKKKFKILNFE
tara:strand:- start:67 stop:171 length:105 start_codon:yes stop_codon:yes gene_type:complete